MQNTPETSPEVTEPIITLADLKYNIKLRLRQKFANAFDLDKELSTFKIYFLRKYGIGQTTYHNYINALKTDAGLDRKSNLMCFAAEFDCTIEELFN